MTNKLVWEGHFTKCGRYFAVRHSMRHGRTYETEYHVFAGKPGSAKSVGRCGTMTEVKAMTEKHLGSR